MADPREAVRRRPGNRFPGWGVVAHAPSLPCNKSPKCPCIRGFPESRSSARLERVRPPDPASARLHWYVPAVPGELADPPGAGAGRVVAALLLPRVIAQSSPSHRAPCTASTTFPNCWPGRDDGDIWLGLPARCSWRPRSRSTRFPRRTHAGLRPDATRGGPTAYQHQGRGGRSRKRATHRATAAFGRAVVQSETMACCAAARLTFREQTAAWILVSTGSL